MAAAPKFIEPKSKVEIRVSCKNLLDRDVTSKSDPLCAMYMQRDGAWYEMGRTEWLKNTLNPDFATPFIVDYYFEQVQKIRFSMYDIDNATDSLKDDDFLGEMEISLGEIVSTCPLTRPLMLRSSKKPAGKSTITVEAVEVTSEGTRSAYRLEMRGLKLDSKDTFGKSDPYLEIHRQGPGGNWQLVHRTEVVKNNLSPVWRPFMLTLQQLASGNPEAPVKFDVYDWDSDGSHDFIGSAQGTSGQMQAAGPNTPVEWPLINGKKQSKKKYKNSGILQVTSCKVETVHSFLDFIFGGMQINFTVGIDFTASNGKVDSPQSLHYINPFQPNEYERAIQAVGDVVRDYDSDKMFPTLGFGARLPPQFQEAVHEFAVNFQPANPFCPDVAGVLQAYKSCIRSVQLYGPTNFAPIIQHVSRFAQAAAKDTEPKNYFVLLILTDGAISDVDHTLQTIVQSASLPMSIIIVGVGDADFGTMEVLDGDGGVLKDRAGNAAVRDIVQFVPYRDFHSAPAAELAKHVLAELPKQVTDYYKMRNIRPNPPRQVAPSV